MINDGYYDAEKQKYFYYLTDHLGNNRVVAEANGTVVQKTHYYPFGMAFAESMGEEQQPYKYNGKELDRRLQLNTYDYAARYMDPAIGRFTSIDPLAEKYFSWSPYVYVMNNPLKYIDPDGKRVGIPITPAGYGITQNFVKNVSNRRQNGESVFSAIGNATGDMLVGAASYTDVNDVTVLTTTVTRGGEAINIDGTSATTIDKIAAGGGVLLPLISGSTIVKGFKKIFGLGEGATKKTAKAFELTGKDGALELYSTKIGENIIEFGGDVSRADGVLTIKNFDIDGKMTNELGRNGVKKLVTDFGKEQGVKKVIIEGARRTTGANPGKTPSPLEFIIE